MGPGSDPLPLSSLLLPGETTFVVAMCACMLSVIEPSDSYLSLPLIFKLISGTERLLLTDEVVKVTLPGGDNS